MNNERGFARVVFEREEAMTSDQQKRLTVNSIHVFIAMEVNIPALVGGFGIYEHLLRQVRTINCNLQQHQVRHVSDQNVVFLAGNTH